VNAFVTPGLGQGLQRIIRRVKNPIAVRRAEVLLESALGASAESLADRYHLPLTYVHELIRAFNRKGIETVHAGTRQKAFVMSPEERSIIVEAGRLTPRAFGFDQDMWTLSHLQQIALERQWVRVANLDLMRTALQEYNIAFRDE